MFSYLKRLLMDEGAFVGFVRAALMTIGLAVETGKFPLPDEYQWLGLIGVGAAMMMRSSVPQNGARPPAK